LDEESNSATQYRSGVYSLEWTRRTYHELLARAERLLSMGESVVLDTSWNLASYRDLARETAARTHSRLIELRCEAPMSLTAARMRARTGSISDVDEDVAAAMAADAEPWPEASVIRTEDDVWRCAERAMQAIRLRPE
jgi:hypothetical protein